MDCPPGCRKSRRPPFGRPAERSSSGKNPLSHNVVQQEASVRPASVTGALPSLHQSKGNGKCKGRQACIS